MYVGNIFSVVVGHGDVLEQISVNLEALLSCFQIQYLHLEHYRCTQVTSSCFSLLR
jgi:hypothetical protein